MRRFVSFGPALVVLLTVIAVLLGAPAAVRRIDAARTSARIVLAQSTLRDDDILERLNTAVRAVADSVRPSIVHLEVIGARGEGRTFAGRSTGSGWVYDAEGHIVTNAHVVRGATRIQVEFASGRTAEARMIRGEAFVADPFTDIAVIKVPADEDLFPLPRATGLMPKQGERVFVFGSPFGFKFSMSEGIISGLGRDPSTANDFEGFTNFIQTDAAVNPGNSGGPLVDIKGRIVGMNVAIATGRDNQGTVAEGQSAGISFAIPLGTIEFVVDQLIAAGSVRRGFMGLSVGGGRGDPTRYVPELKRAGVRIPGVQRDGPAENAGIRSGDIITEIAGQPIVSWEMLRSVVTSLRPEQAVPVRLWRDGGEVDLTVKLGEYPQQQQLEIPSAGRALAGFGIQLGFFTGTAGKPIVPGVESGSAAERAGLRAGQLVLKVGETAVATWNEVFAAAAEQGLLLGKAVDLELAETNDQMQSSVKSVRIRVPR
ncbi:MAG: trypsin-like peptidase domain-containing protein [Phycisphaerales bacterium]